MADAKKTVALVFEGVDKTAAATQSALKNVDKFAGNIQSATQPLADFTTGALKLEAGLLLAGAAVTGFAIKVASDFQTAATDLQKVLSDTDSIEQYTALAVDMSEKYGVASVDVLNSITNYKQAGFSAKEAGELTKSGLDLVIAGNVEAAESSALLVASIKGFGTEAGEAAGIVDLLNQVSNNYAASTGQLLEGFATLSPAAKAAGLSIQETVAILTPGIEVFQSGSEVANALRTSFIALVDDNPTVVAALDALGVSQTGVNGEMRSARDVYFDVAEAFQTVDESQKLYLASSLVGKNRTTQFLAVMDGLDTTLTIASSSFDFLGSAAKEVALQLDTAEIATNRAKTAFTNLFIVKGTPLLDEFSGIANAITEIFQAIGKSSDTSGIAEVVKFIESEMKGLQVTLETVAENLPKALEDADFSGFVNGVKAITDSFDVLFDGIDLTTVDGLVSAIELAGDAFEGLSEFTAGAIESFRPLFGVLGDVVEELQKVDSETIKSFGQFGGAATQLNLLTGAVGGIISPLNALLTIIGANQAVGLLGGMAGLSVLAGGLVPLLAGLAAAATAAQIGFSVGGLLNGAVEEVTGQELSTWLIDAAIKLGILKDEATKAAAGINKVSLNNLTDGVPQGVFDLNDLSSALEDVGKSALQAEIDADTFQSVWVFSDTIIDLHDLSGALENVGEVATAAAKKTSAVTKALDDNSLKERLAVIAAQSANTVAALDADATKTAAAFDSISVSVTSTGDTIKDLFALLGDDNIRKLDKIDIRDQIREETKLREKALELQEKLTKQQIAESKARTASLKSGAPVITVNGDGLQPHLEAFMFEIFEALQVRVNADGYKMLLGA
jgi:TP901 family phage tail tape measure protein